MLESEDDVTYDDGDEFHEIKHTLVPIEEAFEKLGDYNVKNNEWHVNEKLLYPLKM